MDLGVITNQLGLLYLEIFYRVVVGTCWNLGQAERMVQLHIHGKEMLIVCGVREIRVPSSKSYEFPITHIMVAAL